MIPAFTVMSQGNLLPSLTDIMGVSAARVNLCPWSHDSTATDFEDARFNGNTRISVGAGITALDGASTAQKLVESVDNGTHFVAVNDKPDLGSASPVVMRMAAIAKAGERTRIVLEMVTFENFANADISIGFDLSGGNVGHDNTVESSVTLVQAVMGDLGSGWWLCYFDYYYNAGHGTAHPIVTPKIYLDSGSGTAARSISYAGDGSSGAYVWVFSFLPKGIWDLDTRLFHDNFSDTSTIDLNNTRAAGFNWYLHNLMPDTSMPTFGWATNPPSAPTPASNLSITDGIIKIWNANVNQTGWTSQIWSVVTDENGGYRGNVFRAPVMYECYISQENTNDPNWAGVSGTFWGSSVEALVNQGLNPSTHFVEWDIYEGFILDTPSTNLGTWTVHRWSNPASPTNNAFIAFTRVAPAPTPGVTFNRINGVWLNEASSGNGWGSFWHFVNGYATGVNNPSGANGSAGFYHLAGDGGQADGHSIPVFLNTAEQSSGAGTGARYWIDYVSVYGVTDPPERYAFWNAFDKGSDITVSTPAALILSKTAGVGWATSRAHVGKSSGKWYWELTLAGNAGSIDHVDGVMLGIVNFNATLATFPGQNNKGAGLQYNTAFNTNIVGGIIGDSSSTTTWVGGDVIGFAFDADNGKVYIHKNGTWLTGAPSSSLSVWSGFSSSDEWYPAGAIKSASVNITITANFGNAAFEHTAPSGYVGLSHTSPTPSS